MNSAWTRARAMKGAYRVSVDFRTRRAPPWTMGLPGYSAGRSASPPPGRDRRHVQGRSQASVGQDRCVSRPDRTVVYTDGACLGNPGPGGWAWAVPGGRWANGAEARSTNQRMEIVAALEAVRANPGPLEVVSDSTYVVNCFRDRWWEGWLARGWKTKAKQPVANRDLWEPLIGAVRADPERVRFRWVKGHGTDPVNDLVDRLAVEAARTQRGRTGEGTPPDLGPADSPGSGHPGGGHAASGHAAGDHAASGHAASGHAASGHAA